MHPTKQLSRLLGNFAAALPRLVRSVYQVDQAGQQLGTGGTTARAAGPGSPICRARLAEKTRS